MTAKNPVFTTQFNGRRRIRQPVGSGEVVTYTPKLSDAGDFELVETGKRDLYGEIQSHRDSCDIYVLLNRYQKGDLEALSRVQGSYGDFTEMPKTFAEVLNAMIAGEQMFNSLPLHVRQKFDFSLEKFMLGMDNMPDWLEKVGFSSQSQEEPSEVRDPVPSGSPSESEVVSK